MSVKLYNKVQTLAQNDIFLAKLKKKNVQGMMIMFNPVFTWLLPDWILYFLGDKFSSVHGYEWFVSANRVPVTS